MKDILSFSIVDWVHVVIDMVEEKIAYFSAVGKIIEQKGISFSNPMV